ncbi:5-amino-6-(5-phospho-D-ribitylamino)uracil phosphatase YigB [Pantoea sp. Mb-10]|uniref:5-amino-6-(5-phospho-D-ribitylamino)uracil phosphatase YigB n=1 Tax=unclassified Pantoea TaxID=2630326 RepID=UPI001E39A2DC|nr:MULTISPECIES: 5-amino-6-(5-phospho-D-ribitylamino)uracil phosphatase YigB [unclassified Pantoea]MCE0491653.1 5-amino-6-(5-phospho-D-ribitylamino)uracil phosphatase YigB [Pantoea sp. Mb-10]MCE0502840.1 5-amino-6-(5-phospho-D-ribitylamino)uracil phosphatase YigB [Pantoea sp. Pb-8]
MKFYRSLGPIKAITFDLDDTLYDNHPVIRKTTAEAHAALQAYHPALHDFTPADYQAIRDALLAREPDIYHDVSEWRRRSVEQALLNVGLTATEARAGAHEVMAVFHRWRSDVAMPDETHRTLAWLADRVPLVAITNGNADPEKLGIHTYFQFALRAGPHGRAKPWQDMYHLAAERLALAPEHILHVGDDLTTDVAGALRAGLQACWINLRAGNLMHIADARQLPHLEIHQLAALTALI